MTRESQTVDTITADLARRFGDAVPYPVIRQTTEDCLGFWSDARIRDFLPVLAGKCARERLKEHSRRDLSRPTPGDRPTGPAATRRSEGHVRA